MIRQTGGLAVGETSMRSRPLLRARSRASRVGIMPSWVPSSSIRRTSRMRIRSFMRGPRSRCILPRSLALLIVVPLRTDVSVDHAGAAWRPAPGRSRGMRQPERRATISIGTYAPRLHYPPQHAAIQDGERHTRWNIGAYGLAPQGEGVREGSG